MGPEIVNPALIEQNTGEYRCTSAHSTKKCAVGVVKAIAVSNVINYIEINYNELLAHTMIEIMVFLTKKHHKTSKSPQNDHS